MHNSFGYMYNCHSLVCIVAVVIKGRAFLGGCLKVHFGMMSSMEEQRHCHGGDCAVPPFRSRRHSCSVVVVESSLFREHGMKFLLIQTFFHLVIFFGFVLCFLCYIVKADDVFSPLLVVVHWWYRRNSIPR